MRLNKFDNIQTCYNKTLENLSEHQNQIIDDCCLAYKTLMDLLPETETSLFSGHIFPYLESYIELENCINLFLLGLYKSSLISLRSCLELGLVHLFYDRNNNSEQEIQKWLHSSEDTPFRKKIINGIKSINNFQAFSVKTDVLSRIDFLYSELSNYVHTCGYKYSTTNLNKANITQYDKNSIEYCISLCTEVIQILVTLFLLKYPVGMHYTPMDDKFGLNPIVGTFLNPGQSLYLKKVIPQKYFTELEEICLNDSNAIALANWINSLPDLPEEEWDKQVQEQDKYEIKIYGFQKWAEIHKDIAKPLYIEQMHQWATQNDMLKPGT